MKHTDVIVAGLGAMGAATIYQLAKRGVRVIGIDTHTSPHAYGSSHGETRITRCAVGEGVDYVPLVKASHRIWRELEAKTGHELLNQCGCLVVGKVGSIGLHTPTLDFVQSTIDSAVAGNVLHEILDSATIMERYPQITGLTGERGCYEPGGGFVHPEKCIAAQLSEAQALGAIVIKERVLSINQTGDGVSVITDDGQYQAAQVVAALGAWTAPILGAPFENLLRVTRQVLHWFEVDESLYPTGQFPTLIWLHGSAEGDAFYGFPPIPGTGTIKMASGEYAKECNPETIERIVRPAEQEEMYNLHLAGRLKGLSPKAPKSRVCMYTITAGARFIIDTHPAMDRVTVISACSGHGFKHSAGIGEAVAEQIVSGQAVPVLAPFLLGHIVA